MSGIGEWERQGDQLLLQMDGEIAEFHYMSRYDATILHQVTGFSRFENNCEVSLSGLDLSLKLSRS